MEEVVKTFDQQDPVACIISIGTGKANITQFKAPGFFQKALPRELINAMKSMATDCEAVEREVSRRFSANSGIYFRFNVEHGLENISLEEWNELGNIKAKTIAYLGDKIAGSVNEAVVALCNRSPRLTASDLNFVFSSATQTSHAEKPVRSTPVCVVPFSQRISYFIGRTDLLQKIHNCFNNEGRDPTRSVIIVLRAMGGQGKTQTALEYCQRAKNENYDYILWVNSENKNSLEQSFPQFVKALEIDQDRNKPGLLQALTENLCPLESVQERLSGFRYLLVFDNMDEPGNVSNIKTYMELGGKGDIIITSRHLDAEQLGTPIPILPFSQEEGRELLSLRSGRNKSSDGVGDAIELINALGGLPLGLDQAAALIRETNLSYSQFLKLFQKAQEILLDEDLPEFWEYKKAVHENRAKPEQRRKIGIQTTWKMSLDYLGNRPNGASKCHLLSLSAYLHSKSISQASFTPWFKLVSRASSKRVASNESSPEGNTLNCTEESVIAYSASWLWPLIQDLDQKGQAFLKFIQDAYKFGLVSAIHHDDTRGVLFSIHPLVSRWLRSKRDKDHILEAAFLTFHLVRDLKKVPDLMDLHYEACWHVLACVDLNTDLPEHLRFGNGDLRQVGLEFCSFFIDDIHLSEAHFEILRAALGSREGESYSPESDEFSDLSILEKMGYAKIGMGDYNAAKDILLQAKSRTPLYMPLFSSHFIEDLIKVYIKQKDEDSLQWIYNDLVDRFEFLHKFKSDKQLNPRDWVSQFHQMTVNFRPRYDLSVLALSTFLEQLDHKLTLKESEDIRTIKLIAEYYLGLSYFGAAQFHKAQNSFLSLIRKTAELTYSDSILFLEVAGCFFDEMTQRLVEKKDAVDVHSKLVQRISRTRLTTHSNSTILKEIEEALKFLIEIIFQDSRDGFWKANLQLRNIIVPRWQRGDNADNASSEEITNIHEFSSKIYSALVTSTLQPNILKKAFITLKSYIELLGHCESTEKLEIGVLAGHWMLGDFETCLRMQLEIINRKAIVGQALDIKDIHTARRCFIRLGKLDDLEKFKQEYSSEDWDNIQEEEENNMKVDGHISMTH